MKPNVARIDWDARLDNVDVGPKYVPSPSSAESFSLRIRIKCAICNVNRNPARYSNNQIKKYKQAILNTRRGSAPQLPTCIQCTAGNVEDLQCTGCHYIKGLE